MNTDRDRLVFDKGREWSFVVVERLLALTSRDLSALDLHTLHFALNPF
jgi:hypothetical protein